MNIILLDSWLREYLDTKAKPTEISRYLSLCSQSVEKITPLGKDWLYNIEITTNRPDCLSVYGIARELATILPRFNIPAKLKPLIKKPVVFPKTGRLTLKVKIADKNLCPRFTALIFDRVRLGSSPKIIQERLETCGIRALNNVVDISNYLMLELGQPMHTFDYDKIKDGLMILREAREGESLITLDGQSRKLPAGTIVIEDGGKRLIDLCGIMGGENSAVDENTKRVLLFVQTYDPARIRNSCQKMAFRTDAAAIFEKGVDAEGVMNGIARAVTMFEKNCGAKIASRSIDIYPDPERQKQVTLSQETLDKIVGIHIELSEAKEILSRLGFQVRINKSKKRLEAIVPHWRHDVTIPEDLIEEIARIYGYHNLPTKLPSGEIPFSPATNEFSQLNKIKYILKYLGFNETYTCSLVGESLIKKSGEEISPHIMLANPLSEDWAFLRQSLLPSLLEVVARKQSLEENLQFFEIAKVYLPTDKDNLPLEISHLVAVSTSGDFFTIKGVVESIGKEINLSEINFLEPRGTERENHYFADGASAAIEINGKIIGFLGEIKKDIAANFGIKTNLFAIDLNADELIGLAKPFKKYSPISKYPPVVEDLTFVLPQKTPVGEVIKTILEASNLIAKVDYLGAFETSHSFRLTYQSLERNLNDEEVGKLRANVITHVEKKFNAKVKGMG